MWYAPVLPCEYSDGVTNLIPASDGFNVAHGSRTVNGVAGKHEAGDGPDDIHPGIRHPGLGQPTDCAQRRPPDVGASPSVSIRSTTAARRTEKESGERLGVAAHRNVSVFDGFAVIKIGFMAVRESSARRPRAAKTTAKARQTLDHTALAVVALVHPETGPEYGEDTGRGGASNADPHKQRKTAAGFDGVRAQCVTGVAG